MSVPTLGQPRFTDEETEAEIPCQPSKSEFSPLSQSPTAAQQAGIGCLCWTGQAGSHLGLLTHRAGQRRGLGTMVTLRLAGLLTTPQKRAGKSMEDRVCEGMAQSQTQDYNSFQAWL